MAKNKRKASTHKNSLIIVLAAGALLLVILGAGGLWGRGFLTGLGFDFFQNGQKLVLKNVDGEVSIDEGGRLPTSFPSDFPVYPSATLKSSWTAQGGEAAGSGLSVIWETQDGSLGVSNFYKEKLAKSGWVVTASFSDEDSYTHSFEKGETTGFMGISGGEVTTISVTLGFEK